MPILEHGSQKAYELIDFGNGMKLERFGDVVTIRPETDALQRPKLEMYEWSKRAHTTFHLDGKNSGYWKDNVSIPEEWPLGIRLKERPITLNLRQTKFKHLGVFPEQIPNWLFVQESVKQFKETPKVLNLFAYTGGASLAAASAGAEVTHVDSIKQVVNWGKSNMAASSISDIRWIVEDAMKFLQRAVNRGQKYQGIIMDPPAFGRGPKGERWVLEDQFEALLSLTKQCLSNRYFLVLSTYSSLEDTVVYGKTRKAGIDSNLLCESTQIESSFGDLLSLGNTLTSYHI